ncbi:MAG TPA: ATP-binding cassette domain-containing protein [bacterium]|nr:ATP-binding cassette domain-containing protein [bacterium]
MIINIKKLSVVLKNQEILHDLDLEVSDGETMVILGQSGSGKTVLLKTLLGLITPNKGRVEILGQDMSELDDKHLFNIRKKSGMVFQSSALFDSMSVWENVGFFLLEHSDIPENEIRKTAETFLEAVGLDDISEKMPEELSGGMKKRVGIARALASKPQILFYDEPTAGLDVITSASIIKLMKKIHSDFCTTDVIVTHDLAIARNLADHIAVIDEGTIVATGKWDQIINSGNEFVRYFLNIGDLYEKEGI